MVSRDKSSCQESLAAVAYSVGQRLAVNSLTVKTFPVYPKRRSRESLSTCDIFLDEQGGRGDSDRRAADRWPTTLHWKISSAFMSIYNVVATAAG